MDSEADELRADIEHWEGRIDVEVADADERRRLWDACGDAMTWSWQSVGMAREKLVPVLNHFDPH